MSKIFISYRRADSSSFTQKLYAYLAPYYYEDELFVDVDHIPRSMAFNDVILDALEQTHLMLVIIGRKWLSIKTGSGRRRLSQPNDYVRMEVAYALDHDIPIIPVFLNGVEPPTKSSLPPSLACLSGIHGIEVDEKRGLSQSFREIHDEIDQFLTIEQQQAYDIFEENPRFYFNAARIGAIAEENDIEPLNSVHVDDIEEMLEDMWEGDLLIHRYGESGSNQYIYNG